MTSVKFKFEIWKSYVNKIGEMLLNDDYLISKNFREKDEANYEKFKQIYEENFIKYRTNERFTIPIIGKISSGKSTFLNSILFGNYLSSASGIETKFICIIRNNKENKEPKLYKSELKLEKLDYKYNKVQYYYFLKKDEVKGDNILDSVKKINQELTSYEQKIQKSERNINKYFYILEINIPFFNEEEELTSYFELMDVPGLNEKDDFYLKNIIPIIVNKCLFSIYIFDLEKYENEDTSIIYQSYCKKLNSFYKSNSIYILNKIDLITEKDRQKGYDEDQHFTKFKKFLTKTNEENQNEFNVDETINSFLKLNSKGIFNKVNAFLDIKTFFEHIIDSIDPKIFEEDIYTFNLFEYIKKKLLDYFEITEKELKEIFENTNKEEFDKYFNEDEFNEITGLIETKGQGLAMNFDEDDYKKIKYIFLEKNKSNIAIPELNEVCEIIINSMKKSLDEFFNWDHVVELMKSFKDTINKLFDKEDEKERYSEICDNLLNSFQDELDRKSRLKNMEWKPSALETLKPIINSLLNLEPNNSSLKKLKEDFDCLTYFIYNYRRIRIPLLGGYSTGKSSFLNNMIGKDILPVDISRCTNRGIILRHLDDKEEEPKLFRTTFIHVTDPDYWYFEYEKEPICEGYDEIQKKLIELNNEEVDFENAFILLKVHLNIFSEFDFSKNTDLEQILKDKLEFIDFPGLDVKNNFYQEKIFSPLMKFSDGFVFMNECDLILESGNLKILTGIVNEILTRKFNFTYKSCLFLLHKLDKSMKLDIDKAKEKFDNIFRKDKKDKDQIKVNKFSSKLYHTYLDFFNKFITKDFSEFIKAVVSLIKSEKQKEIKNYDNFLKLINNITENLKLQINKKLLKQNNNKKDIKVETLNNDLFTVFKSLNLDSNIYEENIENKNFSETIIKIYNNFLYLQDNYKIQNQRIRSNADSLFETLFILLEEAYDYMDSLFKEYFNYFIDNFNNLFVLIDLKLYGNQFKNQLNFNKIEKENFDLKMEIEKFLVESNEGINKQKEELKNKNQKLKDDFMKKYDEDKKQQNTEKNFENLEKEIQNNIDEFSKYIGDLVQKFNSIIEKSKINDKIVKNTNINYNEISLKKHSRITEKYVYKSNIFANMFKGIGNIFINIRNWMNEKEQIIKNIDDYLKGIDNLILNCCNTFDDEILQKKNEILKRILDNLEANNHKFNGIKDNREEYEKIKKEYSQLITNNSI